MLQLFRRRKQETVRPLIEEPNVEVSPVVAIFRPLYERLEKLDLHAKQGLHGADEVIGLLEAAVSEHCFVYLAQNSSRRAIARVGIDENLVVNKQGQYEMVRVTTPVDGALCYRNPDWRGDVRLKVDAHRLTLDQVRNGLLDYVRFAPHDDAFSRYLG